MTKFAVFFPTPQMTWLRDEAKTLGISVSDLVRRIVDAHRKDAERQEKTVGRR